MKERSHLHRFIKGPTQLGTVDAVAIYSVHVPCDDTRNYDMDRERRIPKMIYGTILHVHLLIDETVFMGPNTRSYHNWKFKFLMSAHHNYIYLHKVLIPLIRPRFNHLIP